MVEEIGELLRESVVQFELLEGLSPPPGIGDEQRAAILDAQAGMRRGLSELVLGCVNSLADGDYPPEESAKLVAHLAATLPTLLRSMGVEDRTEALRRLRVACDDDTLASVHIPLRALVTLVAAQTRDPADA